MNNKKRIIIISIIIIVLTGIGLFLYFTLKNENSLNVLEKQWISDNKGTIINMSVLNDSNIYGKDGEGLIFDFLADFKAEYGITINTTNNQNTKISINKVRKINKDMEVIDADHYVLISKNQQQINDVSKLKDNKVGLLKKNQTFIYNYIKNYNWEITPFENDEEMEKSLTEGTVNYLLIPMNDYLDYILQNELSIVYHFSDINDYYVFNLTSGSKLDSIIKKYYREWSNAKYDKTLNKYKLDLFAENLDISSKDLNVLNSKDYRYGFVSQAPYEILLAKKYKGIVGEYLERFSALSGVDFVFEKCKNKADLDNKIKNKNIDLYLNYYLSDNNYNSIPTLLKINYNVIAKDYNEIAINSLYGLKNQTVYVLKDSYLYQELLSYSGIKIKTYDNNKELEKLAKKDILIALDSNTFNYYLRKNLKDFTSRFSGTLNNNYEFRISGDATLSKLFSAYIQTLNPSIMINQGLYQYDENVQTSGLITKIATSCLLLIIIVIIGLIILLKTSKTVRLQKKLKKEDKIHYIDSLTALKNRNYLNENIKIWDKNTVYPQALIVIDLNKLKYVNDTFGHEEGDKVIQSAANVLIKTQLDNSDIIRTDGNEFLVYLIGYPEKKVVSYIHKLNKEFKNLPHEYGATIGFSMIVDDIKSVDDALNEATIDMKTKKDLNDENEKKN